MWVEGIDLPLKRRATSCKTTRTACFRGRAGRLAEGRECSGRPAYYQPGRLGVPGHSQGQAASGCPGKQMRTRSLGEGPAMPSTRAGEGGTVRRVACHCHVWMEADAPGPSPLGTHFPSLSPSFPRGGEDHSEPRGWHLVKGQRCTHRRGSAGKMHPPARPSSGPRISGPDSTSSVS